MGNKAIKFKDKSGNIFYPCSYYPIGSLFLSVNNINPSTYFGGTWVQIKDRFILACGDTYGAGSTGGNATHTHKNYSTGSTAITIDQMPSHRHGISRSGAVLSGGYNALYNNNGGIEIGFHTEYEGGGKGHTHTVGDTQSSSNIPPYLAIYVWERTA